MYSTTPWVSSGPGPAAGLFRPDRGSAFAGGWGGSARHTHRCRPGTCPCGTHTSLAALAPAQPTTTVVALGLVPRAHFAVAPPLYKIGSAPCRERVRQYVYILGVAVSLNKNKKHSIGTEHNK